MCRATGMPTVYFWRHLWMGVLAMGTYITHIFYHRRDRSFVYAWPSMHHGGVLLRCIVTPCIETMSAIGGLG